MKKLALVLLVALFFYERTTALTAATGTAKEVDANKTKLADEQTTLATSSTVDDGTNPPLSSPMGIRITVEVTNSKNITLREIDYNVIKQMGLIMDEHHLIIGRNLSYEENADYEEDELTDDDDDDFGVYNDRSINNELISKLEAMILGHKENSYKEPEEQISFGGEKAVLYFGFCNLILLLSVVTYAAYTAFKRGQNKFVKLYAIPMELFKNNVEQFNYLLGSNSMRATLKSEKDVANVYIERSRLLTFRIVKLIKGLTILTSNLFIKLEGPEAKMVHIYMRNNGNEYNNDFLPLLQGLFGR